MVDSEGRSAEQAVAELAGRARRAAAVLATTTSAGKNAALQAMADAISKRSDEVLTANAADVDAATSAGTPVHPVDRSAWMATERLPWRRGYETLLHFPTRWGR